MSTAGRMPGAAMAERRIAIIGAGAAGLAAGREMDRAGFDVTIFEKGDRIGGVWAWTPETDADPTGNQQGDTVYSSIYDSLRTNLPRDIMAFMDYPFDSSGGGDDHWPRFPHHSRVLEYLERFADDFDLRRLVQTGARVDRVEPGDGWSLEVGGETLAFDAVMVCNGHYATPRLPALPGLEHFEGRVLHSHNYRRPDPFAGRRVALWGTSASGADISLEIAAVAGAVHWCGNAFQTFPPGKPIGGNRRAWPSPTGIDASGHLTFDSGEHLDVDDFMFCTGYRYDFPFLDDSIVRVEDNWVNALYRQILPPSHPTLAFIGIPWLIVPFPLFEMQARWFRGVLGGTVALPTAAGMRADIERDRTSRLAEGLRQRHLHKLGEAQGDYYDLLADECGAPRLPAWFGELAVAAQKARLRDPAGFRDLDFPAPGPTRIA